MFFLFPFLIDEDSKKFILSTTEFILDKILPTIRKIIFEEAGVVEQFGTLGAPQTSLVINRIVHSKMRSLSDLAVASHANHIFFIYWNLLFQ